MLPANSLPVLLLEDGKLQLTAPVEHMTRWGLLVVHKGHCTDLASVPVFMRGLIPNAGRRVNRAAIFHDWCCDDLNRREREGRTVDPREPDGPMLGAVETDVMFRDLLGELKCPTLMRWIYWTGVRWGASANRARRLGWWRQAVLLLIVTVLTAWLTVPAGIVGLVFLCAYLIAEAVVDSVAKLVKRGAG